MQMLLITLALGLLSAGPAASPEQKDVIAPVQQFVDGFNKGDVDSATAACTQDMAIIDDFPPHEWHGPGALSQWISDFEAHSKKNGLSNYIVTLGAARHVDVTGERAYVVVPTEYTYNQNGKPVKGTAALTVALQKGDAGWRIIAWAWSKN